MSNFPAWWQFVMAPNRDGRADDTADDGAGLTRWGWTYPTWIEARSYIGGNLNTALFKAMTHEQAGALALIYFWDRLGGTRLAGGPDVSLVDWAWTSGGAVAEIQEQLHIAEDRIVGPQTRAAIKAYGAAAFVDACALWRVAYYDALGFRERFPGLYRRTEDCRVMAHQLAGK